MHQDLDKEKEFISCREEITNQLYEWLFDSGIDMLVEKFWGKNS